MPCGGDGDRRATVRRRHVGAHEAQRLGDAVHRPLAQSRAAVQHGGRARARQRPGEEADRGGGIAALRHCARARERAEPVSRKRQHAALQPARHAERLQRAAHRARHAAVGIVPDRGDALGQRGEQRGAMRKGLVAGERDAPLQGAIGRSKGERHRKALPLFLVRQVGTDGGTARTRVLVVGSRRLRGLVRCIRSTFGLLGGLQRTVWRIRAVALSV